MSTPFKEEREKCWNFRDKYWECLTKNNEDNEKCMQLRKAFEKNCSKQWVKHFDRKRQYELDQAKGEEYAWQKFAEEQKRNRANK